MLIGVKIVLVVLVLFVTAFLYSIAFAIAMCAIHRAKAIGLPSLLHDPVYWLLMILILLGETLLAMRKVPW
jgi:hypothetical protein